MKNSKIGSKVGALLSGVVCLVCSGAVLAEAETSPLPGTVVMLLSEGKAPVASVKGPGTFTVWTLELDDVENKLDSRRFGIHGRLSAEDVGGEAYIELLYTVDENTYFSRTRSKRGPMRPIQGTMDSHWFSTPFDLMNETSSPSRLELRVVMPEGGTITIHEATLVTLTADELEAATGVKAGWWSPQQAGWVGGSLGAGIGVMGGVIGLLASRRAKRSLVMGMIISIGVIGAIALVLGVVALLLEQPYAVWYPLVLFGAISLFVDPFIWHSVRKQYEQQELGRIAAMDA